MNQINLNNPIEEELSSDADYAKVADRFRPIFDKIARGTLDREKERRLPYEEIGWLKEAGFGALRIPAKFGGDGLSLPQLFRLLTELAKADSNIVQALRGHFAFVEDRLNAQRFSSQDVWFDRFVKGDLFGNGWTEIGSAKVGELDTRVTKRGDSLLVNGQKYYSTGSIFADWIDLLAHDETKQQDVIVALPRHAEGVEILDDWDGFGQKTTGSGTLKIKNVEIPIDHIIPFENRFKYQTAFYQTFHLATLTGIAQSAVSTFTEEVQKRNRTFSHGNANLVRHDPQILQVIGKASAQSYAAQSITIQVAHSLQQAYLAPLTESEIVDIEANNEAELASAQGQVVISDLVLDLTSKLFNALSASASTTNKQLDRFWRNARVVSSHNPLVYKEKVIGDWEVNRTPLPFSWQIGASKN